MFTAPTTISEPTFCTGQHDQYADCTAHGGCHWCRGFAGLARDLEQFEIWAGEVSTIDPQLAGYLTDLAR